MDNRTKKKAGRKGTGTAARRAEVRAAVAEWLVQVRALLNHIVASAGDMAAEVAANPEGEVARAVGGNTVNLNNIAVGASEADASAAALYLSMPGLLPDPVVVARG